MLRTKTLLGETFVELTPGDEQGPTLPEGGSLPRAQVAESVQLDEIWRTFDARTRDAFRVWMQGTAAALAAAAPTSRPRSPSSAPSRRRRTGCSASSTASSRAVSQLVHDGGTVFQALSERQGQLRGLIQNSETVFSTTARRNQELAELFRILPTFQRESRATLARLNSFAGTADPLVQQLRPAARELSPTLVAAEKAAPDLKAFFEGLRGAINASDTGFPALRRLLSDDFTPLLSRLGGSVGGQDPYLAHLNSIIEVLGMYKHEITAFLGNAAAAVQYAPERRRRDGQRSSKHPAHDQPAEPREPRLVRSAAELQPREPLLQAARLQPARAAACESFANTPCGAGITATLPPRAQVAGDPNFQLHPYPNPFNPSFSDPVNLYDRIKSYRVRPAGDPRRVEHQRRAGPAVRQAGRFQVDRQVPGVHPLPARAAPAVGGRADPLDRVEHHAARLAPSQVQPLGSRPCRVDRSGVTGRVAPLARVAAHDKEEIHICELGDVSHCFWLRPRLSGWA